MQSLIALSTTEAEYIALSTNFGKVINMINFLKELQSMNFPVHHNTPQIQYRTFEDNMSCVKIANNHCSCPRTKHLGIRFHHFRSHVVDKIITIEHVSTKNQVADIFTKPLPRPLFNTLSTKLMGWDTS